MFVGFLIIENTMLPNNTGSRTSLVKKNEKKNKKTVLLSGIPNFLEGVWMVLVAFQKGLLLVVYLARPYILYLRTFQIHMPR